jgi:hypothetical protein
MAGMAFLHGSLSAIDVSLAAASIKAAFGRAVVQFVRGSTRRTTFADNGWVNEQPGDKQALFTFDGYSTKGTAWSDPLYYIVQAATIAAVVTADTSCSITSDVNVFGDGIELVAAANAGRSITARSAGPVSTSWVTS